MKNLVGKQVKSKTGEIATVEAVTVKDVTLVYDETGEKKKISIHSFRRNWAEMEVEADAPETEGTEPEVEDETAQEEELLEDEAGEEEDESNEETAEDEQAEADAETEEPAPPKTSRPVRSRVSSAKPAQPKEEVKADKPKAEKPKAEPKEVKPAKDPSLQGVFDSVLEYAEGLGCETKETFKYIAIRHRKKNIAELHYNKQGVALVIASKSLSKELNAECTPYPAAYNWVLDTKFMVGSDNLNTAYEIIEAGIAYVDQTKPTGKGEKAKAEKANKKEAK